MKQELVSIISPCYNMESYIGRFLDSLIAQTYKHLEIILVNDGSTDNTDEIIKSYIPSLKSEGYNVLYIVQENSGQSSAINNALKHVSGKFLTWPDSDDWLTPDSIEKRVAFLENHPEVGMVRCNIESIDDESGKSLGLIEKGVNLPFAIEDAFKRIVFSKTWTGAGACMIRMAYFDKVVPDREIYVTKQGGQNWQLMLPLAQNYPFWQMPDVLVYCCIRKNSHSHIQFNFESLMNYSKTCEDVLTTTLNRINTSAQMVESVHAMYAYHQFWIAKTYSTFTNQLHYYRLALKTLDSLASKCKLSIILITPNTVLDIARKFINIFRHIIKNK